MSNFRSFLGLNESNSGLRNLKDPPLHLRPKHSKASLKTVQAVVLLTGFNIAVGHSEGLSDFNVSKSGHQPTDQPEEDQREICDSA